MDEAKLEGASRAFERSSGWPLRFHSTVLLKAGERCQVWRCATESPTGEPTSLILKQIESDPARGYSDWASLEFLSQLSGVAAPRFCGGENESGFFLMEDLGEGEDLEAVLRRGDEAEMGRTVRDLAIQMACLCKRTIGKEDAWKQRRSALPSAHGLGCQIEADSWIKSKPKVLKWFDALECEVPSGFEGALHAVHSAYAHPGQWLSFSHGDPAPSNNHISPKGIHLIDFEYGGFRHLLYDLAAWNILCPLRQELVAEMKVAFLQELAEVLPFNDVDHQFDDAWAVMCSYRALAILTWIPPDIIPENQPWAGNWTKREAVFVAVSRLEQALAPVSCLDPIYLGVQQLKQRMQEVWIELDDPELALPQWT